MGNVYVEALDAEIEVDCDVQKVSEGNADFVNWVYELDITAYYFVDTTERLTPEQIDMITPEEMDALEYDIIACYED